MNFFILLSCVVVFTVILVVIFVYAFKKLLQAITKIDQATLLSVSVEELGVRISQYGEEKLIEYPHIQVITETTTLGRYSRRILNIDCDNKELNFRISNNMYFPNYLQIRQAVIEKAHLVKISSPPLRLIWAKNEAIPSLWNIQLIGWVLFFVEVVFPILLLLIILYIKYILK